MNLFIKNKDHDHININEINNYSKRQKNITVKNNYKTLESEVMEYFINDCNQGDINIANKSNILLNTDPIKKKLIIKAFAKGKLCLLNMDVSELRNILNKYGYEYEIDS